MERRKLIAVVGGLALVGGVVVVLRNESAPPPPQSFERFLDERVEYVADAQKPARPTDLVLTALDRTSLRANWIATDGLGYNGFEVRWGGHTRLVQGTETELTDLDANADTTVEVRALDALGNRSEPATAHAVPRLAYDEEWTDRLVVPIDQFDGPEALSPRRWRVLDGGGTDCLGLRPLNGKRLEINCDRVDLQSNVPMRLGMPADDGAVGRVVVTTDGPVNLRDGDSKIMITLLPEPFQDLGALADPFPPGAVVLHITPFGAGFDVNGGGPTAGEPTTGHQTPIGGASPPSVPGVRHRWELRVLPDAVVALRDGEVLARKAVAVPWTVARPRLSFRNTVQTQLDTFGVGGAPESPTPASVVSLGPGSEEDGAASLGNVSNTRLEDASSVRVVASVVAASDDPVTVELGTRSAPAVFMSPSDRLDPFRPVVVYADFPLPSPDPNPKIRLRSEGGVTVYDSHLVVADSQDARRPLPRLTDRAHREPQVPPPAVFVLHESGQHQSGTGEQFPPGGKVRVVVELAEPQARWIVPIKAVEVDLDGERIATVPTNSSAGGRHEFLVDVGELSSGQHAVAVRVVPEDERRDVRSHEQPFEIRPL